MAFDWLLFLGISLIGPFFGNKICAGLEKKMTGEIRREIKFKKLRVTTALFSIAISYIVTQPIVSLIHENVSQDLGPLTGVLSIVIGVNLYLILQRVIYRIALLRS